MGFLGASFLIDMVSLALRGVLTYIVVLFEGIEYSRVSLVLERGV